VFYTGSDGKQDGTILSIENCTVSDSTIAQAYGMRPSSTAGDRSPGQSLITAYNINAVSIKGLVVSDLHAALNVSNPGLVLPYLLDTNCHFFTMHDLSCIRSDVVSITALVIE
jgi:hypothetical protein